MSIRIKGKRFSVLSKDSFLKFFFFFFFFFYQFPQVGYTIVNWMCLFVYLKYKFAATS